MSLEHPFVKEYDHALRENGEGWTVAVVFSRCWADIERVLWFGPKAGMNEALLAMGHPDVTFSVLQSRKDWESSILRRWRDREAGRQGLSMEEFRKQAERLGAGYASTLAPDVVGMNYEQTTNFHPQIGTLLHNDIKDTEKFDLCMAFGAIPRQKNRARVLLQHLLSTRLQPHGLLLWEKGLFQRGRDTVYRIEHEESAPRTGGDPTVTMLREALQ